MASAKAEEQGGSMPLPTGIKKVSKSRRRLVLAVMHLFRKIGPMKGGIWITPFFAVKWGSMYHACEVEAMEYVAAHTSVPVPRIYCAFEHRGELFLVMERIKGQTLYRAWDKMTDAARNGVKEQLRRHVADLRSLRPPRPGAVGSAYYNKLYDYRIPGTEGIGPFDTVDGFHDRLGTNYVLDDAIKEDETSEDAYFAMKMKEKAKNDPWKTRFTHADLSSQNIMVRNGQIWAIIDWQMAGWLPDYYEYTCLWYANIYDIEWRPELASILDKYPEEQRMDQMRRDVFPVF